MSEREEALENWTNQCDHALEQGLAPPAPGCEVSKEAASEVVLGLSTLQSVWPGQSRHGNSSFHSSATSTSNPQGELQDFSSQPQSPADGFYQLGKFKLLEKLGEGGFGMVFRALDTSLGREVALKLPRNRFEPDEKRAARFRRETESLARCDHICIVPILEAGEIEGDLYMASHLCQGPSLAAWLGARETPVPPKQSAAIAMQLAHGLAHAHSAGIIHRDLKPSNVLVDGESDAASGVPPVRITDFGLASWTEEVERNTATGELFGTVNYMSPEQVAGNESVDHRSDIFSLGSILYEMLVGKPPHASESLIDSLRSTREDVPVPPRQLQPNVSRDLETICLRCLEKRPQDRFENCEQLTAELSAFLDGRPIQTRPAGPIVRLIKWGRRQPIVAMLTLLILLLLLSGMVVTTAFSVSLYQSNKDLHAEKESALVAREAARAALVQSLAARIELTSESRRILSSSQARETLTQLASIRNPNIAEERALWTQAKSNVVSSHFDADFRSKTLLIPDERLALPIATDPSGSCLVAACSSDGRTRLMLSQNSADKNGDWQEIFELPNSSSPKQLLVSDEAKTIVYVTAEEEVVVLRRNVDAMYAQIQRVPILENAIVALARRGDSLAWASGNTAKVLSIGNATAKRRVTVEGQVRSLAFSDDSQKLAIANENRVAIWDPASEEIARNLEHANPAAVCSIAWDRKGTHLLAGREDFHAYLWQLECPESPVAKLQGIQGWIRHVSFFAEDLALVGGESGCMLFDLANSQVARQSDGKVTSDWDRGMLLSMDGQVSMFELENFSIRQPMSRGETNIAICSKTKPLLITADYASVQIWNRDQQEIVRQIQAEEVLWIACASSPHGDDDLVLLMQHDGVYAHPMLPGPGTRLLESEEFLPFGLVYSEQRGELIWLGTDSQLHKRNVFTGDQTSVEFSTTAGKKNGSFSGSLAISHCGEFVAIADKTRGRVSLFDLEKNSVSEVLSSTTQVLSMAVQEDAREIAIAASEGVTLVSKLDGTWIRTDKLSLPSAFWLEYDKLGRLHFALADGSLGRDSRVSSDDEALTFHGGTKPFSNCTTLDGSTLYTVGRNLKLYRWNLEKIEELLSESTSPKQPASDRVFINSNESALKESGI